MLQRLPLPNSPTALAASALLPLILLLLALSSLFLFGQGRSYLMREHDWTSSSTMAQVAHLSPQHNFLLFHRQTLDDYGNLTYEAYNRYPLGGYALLKLAIFPFDDSLTAQIYAARLVMLIFFAATAILAWLSLSRITANPWLAAAATLLAFSAFPPLYYSHIIGEVMFHLFGILLVFHGMVVFLQEGRFRQLLLKTAAALLLGWHTYPLLLLFILLGLGHELLRRPSPATDNAAKPLAQLKPLAATFLRSRYLHLGIFALLFGLALLTFNLTNEYLALDGRRSLIQLPTVESILFRLGADAERNANYAYILAWPNYLEDQLYRVNLMSLPHALAGWFDVLNKQPSAELLWHHIAIFITVTGGCLAGLILGPHKLLLTALALSGILWAALMRNQVAFHPFESVYYIGITLVFFTTLLLALRSILYRNRHPSPHHHSPAHRHPSPHRHSLPHRHSHESGNPESPAFPNSPENGNASSKPPSIRRHHLVLSLNRLARYFPIAAALAALPLFILSAHQVQSVGYDPEVAQLHQELISDFANIREHTAGKTVFIPLTAAHQTRTRFARAWLAPEYYLHDSVILFAQQEKYYSRAQFVVTGHREPGPALLTPQNNRIFLYDRASYAGPYGSLVSNPPTASSYFDLYLSGNVLTYLREPCSLADAAGRFSLHLYPLFPQDVTPQRRQHGFNNLDFHFGDFGVRFAEKCILTIPLPDYPLTEIETGQGDHWQLRFLVDNTDLYRAAYFSALAGAPVHRAPFDLYIQDDRLYYLKEPCAPADIAHRFYLHLVPVNNADLPPERQQHGTDNLDFDFTRRGARFDGKCLAVAALPNYPIKEIRTGQFLIGGPRSWETSFPPPPQPSSP